MPNRVFITLHEAVKETDLDSQRIYETDRLNEYITITRTKQNKLFIDCVNHEYGEKFEIPWYEVEEETRQLKLVRIKEGLKWNK